MSRESRRRAQLARTIQRESQGKTVTIERTDSSYDPSTGDTTTTVSNSATVAVTIPNEYQLARIDETLIQAGDTVVQVPAKGLDLGTPDGPKSDDRVLLDGRQWGIVQIGRVWTGEDVGAYTLQLRR